MTNEKSLHRNIKMVRKCAIKKVIHNLRIEDLQKKYRKKMRNKQPIYSRIK